MGQQCSGILWGIEPPSNVDFNGDLGIVPYEQCMFQRFMRAMSTDIEATMERLACSRWDVQKRFLPDHNRITDVRLLGFWVAVGGSGMDGIPYLDTLPLVDIATMKPYACAAKNARVRWRRFANWCMNDGITLPKAQLWMTITETA